MDSSANPQASIEQLAEEFLARHRRGERPGIADYTRRYPDLADEIREVFAALLLVEEAGPRELSRPHGFRGEVTADGKAPTQLGDYRIVREVARGGMGVVYEAVQEALGRHVALKVLPYEAATKPIYLRRFAREARAAARLHHTNIVPVHDVGEHQGVHYYAMQFIQGQSLDEVLRELKHLGTGKISGAPDESLVQSLAESVCNGRFVEPAGQVEIDPLGRSLERSEGTRYGFGSGMGREGAISASLRSPSSVSSLKTGPESQYYRTVARLGLQVAEALAYAHSQKIVHRDIKPSNLLLDLHGTIWVTDFGLAKQEEEDLTHAGDVVGTLRYMAPERFNGVSDARGDIYSLGLTLYEMLLLRPAFDETDRGRLIHQINNEEPVGPRRLDRRVPRDLETVVVRAYAKEPSRRYASAQDMVEDLRRFLADRPILARRTTATEHAWRWIRRNPGWAVTLVIVFALLLLSSVGGTLLSWHLRQALVAVQGAETDRTEQLWQSYLRAARAERSSGRIGRRFAALDAIRKAATIRITPELRDEAVAALVLSDAEVAREWEGYPEGTIALAFDASLERYARMNKDGALTVCRLTETGEEMVASLPSYGHPPYHRLWLSADGRFLAYGHSGLREAEAGGLRVWRLDTPAPAVLLDEPAGTYEDAVSFHPSGERLAVGHRDGVVSIYELGSGKRLLGWKLDRAPQSLAFHPSSNVLAAACEKKVRLFDTDSGRELNPLHHPERVTWISGLAWHPDGRHLASGADDFQIRLWDIERGIETMTFANDHGIHLTFNRAGDRLASVDWARQGRLWDVSSNRLVLTLPGSEAMQFNADGSMLGWQRVGTKVRLWRLAEGRELRILRRPAAEPTEQIYGPALQAEGRALAAASLQKLTLFNVQDGSEMASVRLAGEDAARPLRFQKAGALLTGGRGGLAYWPVNGDPSQSVIRLGPPRRLTAAVFYGADASQDGRVVAVPKGRSAVVIDPERPGHRVVLEPAYDVRHCAVSPDGRWVVTCGWHWDGLSPGIHIWEAKTGRHVRELPLAGTTQTNAIFSPDGSWLATTGADQGCRLWGVGTWQAGCRFDESSPLFSPDGKLLALTDVLGAIRLVEPATGREVIRLTGPEPTLYWAQCFGPDGTQLIAVGSEMKALYVWDLRLIRKRLNELGMDWDWPEFATAAGPPRTGSSPHVALTAKIDPGFLRGPVFGNDRQEIALFSLCLALQPLNPDAYLQRGLAYERLVERRRALADYDRFLTVAPPDDNRRNEVLCRRVNTYQQLGDYPAVASAIRDLLNVSPDLICWPDELAHACNRVAWHYVKRASQQETWPPSILSIARKAAEIEPFDPSHQLTLGATLHRLGQQREAIRCLEAHLKGTHESAGLGHYFLAMSYQRLGDSSHARECFERGNSWWQGRHNLSPGKAAELAVIQTEAATALGLPHPPNDR
jgi:serine/threonine protein kinase/WD40 repeat protein/tetratricopeptide (TPR) repeat protein